jgi:tRNA nucleotidyltransferase (CCA-adding enzyme)
MHRLHPPATVLEIAERLESAGFETWCVGGAIRDALLGHPHLDWDLATSATPAQVRTLFGNRQTIPIGVEFGTVGVLDRAGHMHEVTTFRRDVRTDGRHAVVEFGASLDEDLARRDFTINAIAYSPRTREVRDPFDGRADLERRIVRAVGDPDDRMREDRLRALRAIRFAARFDFSLDPATRHAIERSAPFLGRLSPERVKQELDKTMEQVACPSAALVVWQETGAFRSLIPQLDAVPRDVLRVVDYLAQPGPRRRPARRVLRYAGLLASLQTNAAAAVMTGLRSSRNEIQIVSTLIDRWHDVGPEMQRALVETAPIADAAVRRWASRISRLQIGAFMRLADAVWTAKRETSRQAPSPQATRSLYRRLLATAFRDPIDLGALAVDGDDLRRAGIPPGPMLGRILNGLLAAVLEDPARNTTDWLLQEARRMFASDPPALPPGGEGAAGEIIR